MDMDRTNTESTIWKVGSIASSALVAVCIGAGYVDVATHFRFDFDYKYLILALFLGLLLSFVSVIGWAKQSGSAMRLRLAGIVFIAPWTLALIGYAIDGFNVHGPSALLLYVLVPGATILAVILLMMAGY